MRDVIVSLFGVYTPVTTVLTDVVTDADGVSSVVETQVVAAGLAGVDWPYVSGVFLFAITLYCFLRLVGCLLKG